jgi:DNA replication ATP-dependent helicase Dna2
MQGWVDNRVADLPSGEEMARFLRGMRRLVLDEAATVRQQIHTSWSRPLAARVAEGRAIEGVRVVGIGRDGRIALACSRNSSRFREGDMLCLNRGDPFAQPAITVTVEEDDETRLVVSSAELGANWGELEQEPDGWVLDEGYLDLSNWFLDALDEAGDTNLGRTRVLPLLMGYARPQMDPQRYERGLEMGEGFGLNYSQTEALAQAYATDLTYLIQGPPGTGKTRVLAHLAQALVADGERVLVTSFTHRAINNALNKVVEVDDSVPTAKIGQEARAGDLLAPNFGTFDASPMAEMAGGYVLGATPFATRTFRLGGVEFDTVIFDEASQITLPLAVMGMLAARRFIFIGDQKQMPPVLTTRLSGGALRDSVFGSLVERGYDTMLTETYRLSSELAEWSSRHFYEGQLTPAPWVAGWRVAYPRPPSRLLDILDPDEPKVFWDLDHRNTTTRSYKEADAVVELIAALLGCGFAAGEIAVVVPYRTQAREIRSRLRQVIADTAVQRQIVVDTVERMQGQERDLVIVSLTTSNPAFAAGLAEFFFQPERLNVAVTRPRKKLIIAGSRHVLKATPEDPALQESVGLLKELLLECTTFGARDEDLTGWGNLSGR